MNSPLMAALFRVGSPEDSAPYVLRLRHALLGGLEKGTEESSSTELLVPLELREFPLTASDPVSDLNSINLSFVTATGRLLIVVIDTRPMPDAGPTRETSIGLNLLLRIDELALSPDTFLVEVLLKAPGSLYENSPDARLIRLGLTDLDERDLRLPFLELYTLQFALRLFAPDPEGKSATLFFSHAKRDGVPLTTATKDWLRRLKGFETYYDSENLDLSGDIAAQLSTAVASAIVIVFQSDAFDHRFWCQTEVLWAEQHARPVVSVDARWRIAHAPSVISFDSMPGVRIPDGSVVRIYSAALVEALRVELFKARVRIHGATLQSTGVVAIPRSPSILSLHAACKTLRDRRPDGPNSGRQFVVYPNPSLPKLILVAANELAEALCPGCKVVSLDEFRLAI